MDNHGIARVARTARTEEQRRQDLEKIRKYRELEDAIRDKTSCRAYDDPALFPLTSKLLRLNPEYYTIWNVRRRCLTSGLLSRPSAGSWPSRAWPSTLPSATTSPSSTASSPSPSDATPPSPTSPTTGKSGTTADLAATTTTTATTATDAEAEADANIKTDTDVLQSELTFTIPLLLEFPKCYWIWKYRKWILEQAILRLPKAVASGVWDAELALASKMLVKDCRNFHAWGYRRYLVARLESPDLLGRSLAEDEFAYTSKMIHEDLSNFSAWHNRSRLMLRVLDERGADDKARAAFLEAEMSQVQEALNVGPEDQSLWYYHRYLMSQVIGSEGKPIITPNLTVAQKISYLDLEIEFIKDLLQDFPNLKWPYEALLEYTFALCKLQPGAASEGEEKDPNFWLAKLRKLDAMQAGRWNDVERDIEREITT
ncbi:putative geranylgeranyl transferase type-2 subunit alpha [Rosellinia necatrix]|uniref:Geranylgeranyl transferase type-2 subunit alpha n=1 Tax=Rosellinia necatrix TaxID=77044 RepID=A0A1W2TW01_ROSNE|nr:putative geranylgeranyl transferase type-2 subunit alpha [Rosellinia necatrix]